MTKNGKVRRSSASDEPFRSFFNPPAASDRLAGDVLTPQAGTVAAMGAEQILHYMIQTRLGEGGMGVVYKAMDQKLNRSVALKFLPTGTDRSENDVERLLQEANALSALNHPHIATIYDVEMAGELHFLVLEYLPGGTLKAKLRQTYCGGGNFSVEEAFRYAEQTAEGLAYAHEQGIIHRDVKTSNLMLTAGGDIKITDFGLAKLNRSSVKTIPGSLLGTIAYMSPEQALGMDVDPRSDVFSLGTVLFELLTGRLPFDAANDAAMLTKVANARAPELKSFRADLPSDAQRIIEKALKKRLDERYPTMADMLADLRVARNSQPFQTRSISRNEGPLVRAQGKRWRAFAAAGGLALAGALVYAITSQGNVPSIEAADGLAVNRLAVPPLAIVGHDQDDKTSYDQQIKLAQSYANLGGNYLKLKRYSEAIAAYRQAVSIDPAPLSWYWLGTSLYLDHWYRDAVDAHKKAVALNPTEGSFWGALGDAEWFVPGMADSAIEAHQTAVSLKEPELVVRPGDANLRAQIAGWLTLTNKRRALKEIDKALRLDPRHPQVQAAAVSVYEQLGMRDKALTALKEALKLGYAAVELQDWPRLENLRQDRRYKQIVETSTKVLIAGTQ